MATDQQVLVVMPLECLQGPIEFVDGRAGADPEQLFFMRAPEALDAAIVLGRPDKGWAGLHTQEPAFGLEGPLNELTAIVMVDLRAGSDGLLDGTEGLSGCLLQGGDGFEPIGFELSVDAQEFAGAVVIDAKDRDLLTI